LIQLIRPAPRDIVLAWLMKEMTMEMLAGRVAVVTGGSSGIGLAIARRFAAEGARVVITGRRKAQLLDAAREIGPGTLTVEGDVADAAHHVHVADEVVRRLGPLDIYVANAGVATIRHSALVSEADYDAQFATNARGTFFGVQKMLTIMRDSGAVLLVGSIASRKVLDGHAVYAGTKAAIGAFARSWAIELKERRIRVNVLSPGPTETAILGKLGVPEQQRESFAKAMAAAIPLGRMGTPDELAGAALFLASDAARFITGVDLRVDGGMTLL
jgi:NAD(P)-dependent dehydrogenase (short-subunit alcohol dehydrogenase family)